MQYEKGFTLLESLMSMAVFAVAMLAVIGLQIHAIQSDANTTRKDAAVQLLNTAVELVECSDYDDSSVFKSSMGDTTLSSFISSVKAGDTSDVWLKSSDGKVRVFQRFTIQQGGVDLRIVYLVAAWNDVMNIGKKTISRVVTKPQNFIQ